MKNIILIFTVLTVFGIINTKAQCTSVVVENVLDCNVPITIKAYDCNGTLIESVTATLTPGHWAIPSINNVPVTNNVWCDCAEPTCNTYRIFYAGVDVTGKEICCPPCPPSSCSKACCALFQKECFVGKVYFTSKKPPRCP